MTQARAWLWGIASIVVAGACMAGCSSDDGGGRKDPNLGSGTGGASPSAAGQGGATAGSTSTGGSRAVPTGAAGSAGTGVAGTGAAAGMGPGPAGRGAAGGAPMPPGRGAAGTGTSTMPAAGSGAVVTNPAECPAAPADAPAQAVQALAAVNNYRVPAGAGCATMISQINAAATAHCAYYAMYMSGDMCISNPHLEVMGCAGFTGANPGDRMKAAGYTSFGGGEVMAFVNSAQGSVDTWVNSVWHRIPILDPWTTHLGYGSSGMAGSNVGRCDTIDFGRGTPAPANTVVVYPYDAQTNVPLAFNGQYEGPMPPAPPTGWPSSAPISIAAQKIMVTEHVLTKDGDATPIEHVWLDSMAQIVAADMRRSLTNVVFMYANVAFEANTKYRVKISGTYAGGMLSKEWTFTTGAAPARPGRR